MIETLNKGSKLGSRSLAQVRSLCWPAKLCIHLLFLLSTHTVQLTTFRPLAAKAAAAAAGSPAGGATIAGKPKGRPLDSSDTSDYENLSSCTSGRYATLPPQSNQFGGGGGGSYRDHYAAAAGVVFRPAAPDNPGPHSTLSLQRPVKRSHWLNQNGRPSDVLARVFQANQDWLECNDPDGSGNAARQRGPTRYTCM